MKKRYLLGTILMISIVLAATSWYSLHQRATFTGEATEQPEPEYLEWIDNNEFDDVTVATDTSGLVTITGMQFPKNGKWQSYSGTGQNELDHSVKILITNTNTRNWEVTVTLNSIEDSSQTDIKDQLEDFSLIVLNEGSHVESLLDGSKTFTIYGGTNGFLSFQISAQDATFSGHITCSLDIESLELI